MSMLGALFVSTALLSPKARPADVVKAFYQAANEGRCDQARSLLTREAAATIDRTMADEGGFEAFCRGQAGIGRLKKLTVLKEATENGVVELVVERLYAVDDDARRRTGHYVQSERLERTPEGWRLRW